MIESVGTGVSSSAPAEAAGGIRERLRGAMPVAVKRLFRLTLALYQFTTSWVYDAVRFGRHSGTFKSKHHAAAMIASITKCYHFRYFLGTDDGRFFLSDSDLVDFLGLNPFAHIKWRRLTNSTQVVSELRTLSLALPRRWWVGCLLVSVAPLWSLRALDALMGRLRARA